MCEIWKCCHVPWCMSREVVEKRREGGGVLFESHSIGKWLCWKTSGMLYIQVDSRLHQGSD